VCIDVKTPPKVALLVETSNAYARGLLRGFVSYIREHRPWSLYLSEHNRGDRPPGWLAGWKGQGIIARIETPAMAAVARKLQMPIVDVSAARLIPSLPWFETDDGAIAHLAAEHLIECGFKQFAFAGDERFNWSNWRCEHYQRSLKAAGHECHVYRPSKGAAAPDDQAVVPGIRHPRVLFWSGRGSTDRMAGVHGQRPGPRHDPPRHGSLIGHRVSQTPCDACVRNRRRGQH
jgi:DNA-binding LacI/PurR family transcriptional regulator